MPRIESKVEDLISSDAGMRDAVKTVIEHNKQGEVKWIEIKDEITSGHWGRLIESVSD